MAIAKRMTLEHRGYLALAGAITGLNCNSPGLLEESPSLSSILCPL